MNLKKNSKAKTAAVLASLTTLLVGWGLVHQNTPLTVAADTVSTMNASSAQSGSAANSGTTRTSSGSAMQTMRRHTRTHVS